MSRMISFVRKKRIFFLTLLICMFLTSCGAGTADGTEDGSAGGDSVDTASVDTASADTTGNKNAKGFKPVFKDAEFHEDEAEGNDEAKVDLSSTSDGYFGVLCDSDARIKLQVFKDSDTYTYDIEQGKPMIFPLQCGDGDYTIKVMKNVSDNKYYELYTTSTSVSLSDSKAPFVRPNAYANYSKSSACVKKASEMAKKSNSESDFVNQVYKYICKGVDYDFEEAKTVESGYVPDPDEVMKTGKGICFDYASLAASMLRSQGIPTKVIFGYVAPDNLYHAWNMFYTDETGWVSVKFDVKPGDWNRLDLTFSANGENADFIGDGTNYSDVYQY